MLFIEPYRSPEGLRCIKDDALALLAAKLCFYRFQKRSRYNLSLPLRKYGHLPRSCPPSGPRSVLQCIGACMAASCQPIQSYSPKRDEFPLKPKSPTNQSAWYEDTQNPRPSLLIKVEARFGVSL